MKDRSTKRTWDRKAARKRSLSAPKGVLSFPALDTLIYPPLILLHQARNEIRWWDILSKQRLRIAPYKRTRNGNELLLLALTVSSDEASTRPDERNAESRELRGILPVDERRIHHPGCNTAKRLHSMKSATLTLTQR